MKVLTIVGARPQFIKAGPVSRALKAAGIQEYLLHTGQHYDREMSQVFFEELDLRLPDLNLQVGSGSHATQTAAMLTGIEGAIRSQQPDWVLVYGDTNSTLAGALAAAKLHVAVAHVEAGLRSFNRRMPEEINRVVTDHLSTLLFCPTGAAVENLKREGIQAGVYLVGDVMYDAALAAAGAARERSGILRSLALPPKSYVLATIHRAENTDNPARLAAIMSALAALSDPGRLVILPLHPRTSKAMDSLDSHVRLRAASRLRMIPPVSYLDMVMLEMNAKAIITDSGGVQKEAYFHRVPCVTLRDETEWIETVSSGWNTLCIPDAESMLKALANSDRGEISDYGSGSSAEHIADALMSPPALP